MKEEIINLLRSTEREGMEKVIDFLEKSDFFIAPASAKKHLSHVGGLMIHSLNVYKMAKMLVEQVSYMKPELAQKLPNDSVIISSLLHDICKTNVYKTVPRWRKDNQGRWESYEAYENDASRFPAGHGEKSVIMLLSLGLKLTNEEMLAIRWHMGAWGLNMQSFEDRSSISIACEKYPLAAIIQSADNLATYMLETEDSEK